MKVEVCYGGGIVSLNIPEANLGRVIRPWQDETKVGGAIRHFAGLHRAMAGPDAKSFQAEIAGRRLCVLLDDATRDEPFEPIFEQLFARLQKASFVQFLICTGTHEPDTPGNGKIKQQIEQAAHAAGIGSFAIHVHDCEHDEFIRAGATARGTEIIYNTLADQADVFLALSDVKVHYFAGYSNPIKNFVPGICAFATAEQNHSLALDEKSTFGVHPWHKDRGRRNNPLAEDQLEGMRLIVKDRPVFTLITITTAGQIRWARFGPVRNVSAEAFTTVDQRNTHTVAPVGRLIVSPGGLPNDIDLYIAQRALELTKSAVTDGGEILFLAACPGGVGEKKTLENFYNRLTAPIEEILQSIESEYKLYSHKPYKFAQMFKRLRRIWIHSQMPDDLLAAAHLHPARDPQAVVDGWLAEQPDAKIMVVDGANKIALYAAQSRSLINTPATPPKL
jgi:nickel-dependent lactate racemase